MTADAKVGLLLGLLFIVIIAFLVNGLPTFIEREKPTTPAAAIPAPSAEDIVLDNGASRSVHRLNPGRIQPRQADAPVADPQVIEPVAQRQQDQPTPIQPVVFRTDQAQPSEVIQNDPPVQPVEPIQPAVPVRPAVSKKYHVVQTGQNLAVIAQKYYGPDQGNRRIVIQKLYEANTKVLKSADTIRVGDKLLIPPLEELLNTTSAVVNAPSPTQRLMDRVSGMFERVNPTEAPAGIEYVVQSGDSLWAIAQQNLGDGNRYKEIVQYNKNVIRNADNLSEGMRIRIPPK